MIQKLSELLGEELSTQVTQKLGDVELAVMNDGTVVNATKHDNLKIEFKALETKYSTDISGMNSKLDAATANAADYDSLKGTIDTLKADNVKAAEDYRIETSRIKKANALNFELMKSGVDEQYLDMVKSQINLDNLVFDGDDIIGLSDSVNKAKDSFPKLFGEMKKLGVTPQSNTEPPQVGKREQLIEEYNLAEKQGNPRKMMELQNKIKKLE